MEQGRETNEAMVMDSGNKCPWLRGPVNACHVRIHGRGDPSMRCTIVRRRALEKHFLHESENTLSTRFVCTLYRKRTRGQNSVYFYLILKTFTTHFLSKDRLASTKRKFLWTALSSFLLKNDPKNHFDLFCVGIWFQRVSVDTTPSI